MGIGVAEVYPMNTVNRVLLIIELMAAIALMPILVAALVLFRPAVLDSANNLTAAFVSAPNAAYTQAICIAVAGVIFIVAILLLFLEVRRPSVRGLRVQQVTDGQVEVTAEAISSRLEHDILAIPDIVKVKPHVLAAKKEMVDLVLELEAMPDVGVAPKTQEVIAVARRVMEEQMGLKVGKIQVQVDLARRPKKPAGKEADISPAAPHKEVDIGQGS
jgi:hypothetical protein